MAKSNKSTDNQNTKKEEEVVNIIDQILEAVSKTDAETVKKHSTIEDYEVLKSTIALEVLRTAHNMGYLKNINTSSTMREEMYNLVAHDTKKSVDFHKKHEASQADTLKDIMADKNAVLVFSTMYPKKIQAK